MIIEHWLRSLTYSEKAVMRRVITRLYDVVMNVYLKGVDL